jgi:hypothetical protein
MEKKLAQETFLSFQEKGNPCIGDANLAIATKTEREQGEKNAS